MLRYLPFDRSVLAQFAADPPEVRRRARLVAAFSLLGFVGGITLGLMMPDVGGPEVAAALEATGHPAAGRLVFMTGGAITERAQGFLANTSRPVLDKPIEPAELAGLLAAAGTR